MSKKSLIERARKEKKFSTREFNICRICGRTRGYMREFDMCRICFRERALGGEIPGVQKSSW